MSEISKEKNIQKDNQNSPSSKPSTEKTTSKSFQSEAISTIQNSVDSKDFLSNSNLNNLSSLFPSKPKNKENISQQKTLNNFIIDDNINKYKNNKNNSEQNVKGEEKENNMKKEEKQENMEKSENLFLQKKRLMKKSDIVLKNKLLKK